MDSQQHHCSKRLAAAILTVLFVLTCLPAALALDMNVDAGFYFKQSRNGTCTLASAAMMLRRRAYIDGLDDWYDVTENTVRSSAWSGGLSHSFTYNEMQVAYATLPSGTAEKTQTLVTLLSQHPEGVVLYDRTRPHAVLLTDYTNGEFYCSDPAGSVMSGRVPLSQANVSFSRASCYWYVVSDHNDLTATQGDGLRFEGMLYPENIRAGSGMALAGTVCSAADATVTQVEVAVLDAADQTIQSAVAAPNAASWSFKNIDSSIRFGELPAGTYTYMVLATDSTGRSICFASDFTVSDNAASSAAYWSVQDTSGSKLVQQTDAAGDAGDTSEQASQDVLSWIGGLFE